jgi:UDPglucose 6-dehydrogenase
LEAYDTPCKFRGLSNPGFLAERTAIPDLLEAERVLIGSEEDEAGKQAEQALVEIYANSLAC